MVEDHYRGGDAEDRLPWEPPEDAEYNEAGGEAAKDAEVEWAKSEGVSLDEDHE